jgi:hypothetical protein
MTWPTLRDPSSLILSVVALMVDEFLQGSGESVLVTGHVLDYWN